MAKRIEIEVNGRKYPVHSDADTPLLFVLREEIGLTGTKYGCGEGQCGACTVLIGGSPRRSCQVPVGKPKQQVDVSGGPMHAHTVYRDPRLANLSAEELASLNLSRRERRALEREQKRSRLSPKPNCSCYLKRCLKSNPIAPATTATVTRSMMATNAFLLVADSFDCTKETRLGQK